MRIEITEKKLRALAKKHPHTTAVSPDLFVMIADHIAGLNTRIKDLEAQRQIDLAAATKAFDSGFYAGRYTRND